MQKFKATVLSTRPIDAELINNAASQNIKIEVLPFIETEPIDSLEVYDEIENILLQTAVVVFTSMNAVEAVASHLHDYKPDWKIYCIGNTTKKLVQEYFGDELIAADATDANELAEQIVEDGITREVVFFCGNKRRDELPAVLNANDIEVNEIEVYQTNMLHHKIEKPYDAILFFSPSAVQSFFSNNKLWEGTIPFAIGNTTANALKKYTTNKIIIADEPGKSNLVTKAIEYLT
jgi:uroporphyrinogen-III synthase